LLRTTELHPNPENATVEDLQVAMEATPTKRGYIRLAAIRALLMGIPREAVCKLFFRTDRVIRLWIECFNNGGIDALIPGKSCGRPRKAALEVVRELLTPVLQTPFLANQVHWTAIRVHGFLKEQLAVDLGYRTVVRWLHELDFHLRAPRLWPQDQDEEKRKTFLEKLQSWQADPQADLWFLDESGIEGDPRPRRRWAQPGKPRTLAHTGNHIRQNVIGAVCPQSGALFSLIVDGVDGEIFQFYLDELSKAIPKVEGRRQILIMDNASWHKAARLNWHHFQPEYLSPYSPDFNPIERLWLRLKADWFYDFVAQSSQELSDRLCTALKSFINDSAKTASICAIRK
jgi:transposase